MAGPVYVEDDTLARTLASMFANPGAGGVQIANARSEIALREAQRQKLLDDRKREEEYWLAKGTLPNLTAKVTAAEQAPVPQPDYGNVGAAVVPSSGAPPLRLAPDIERENVRATEARQKGIEDARTALTQAGSKVAALGIKSTDDVSKFYSQYGTGLNLVNPAPAGSAEERRRMDIINPSSFVPKEPTNPYDEKYREPLLDRASAGIGSMNAATAEQVKNLLDAKYAPKTTIVENAPHTIQQPMTPRDAALYDAATRLLRPAAPTAAATPAAPPPPASAAQAAPATGSEKPATTTAPSAPAAAVPKTEAPASATPALPAPPPPPQQQAFLNPKGTATIGDPLVPKQPSEAIFKAQVAQANVRPAWAEMAKLMGADPITGAPLDPSKGYTYLPTTWGGATQRAVGQIPILGYGGQAAEYMAGGDPTKLVQFYNAGEAITESLVRLTSGATVLPSERQSYYSLFVPAPTDPPEVIATKFQRIANWDYAISKATNPAEARVIAARMMPGDPSVVLTGEIQARDPTFARSPWGNAPARPTSPTAAAPARSAADTDALNWANANPNDPRAAQIKQRLGVQ